MLGIVAEMLFARHPDLSEHRLSLMRANLVNRSALADVAHQLCVVAHAVSNLTLAVYILATGTWWMW